MSGCEIWMEIWYHECVNFWGDETRWWWWHPTSAGRFWSWSLWRKSSWSPRSKFHRQFLFVWEKTSLKYVWHQCESKHKEQKRTKDWSICVLRLVFGKPQGNGFLVMIKLMGWFLTLSGHGFVRINKEPSTWFFGKQTPTIYLPISWCLMYSMINVGKVTK